MSLTVGQLREHLANIPAHTPVFLSVRHGDEMCKPAAQPDRETVDVERPPIGQHRVAAFLIRHVATPGYWYTCKGDE